MSTGRITICLDEPIGVIRPEIYGQFIEHLGSCIDEGIWVGEDSKIPNLAGLRRDVVEALQELHIPVLRWPGGCYADDYHWEDGVGPAGRRPRRVNLWWGQKVENNQFGTHEFIRLCRYLGAQPYLAGNLGSGTIREMRDWVEYCNFPGDSDLSLRRAANGSPQPFGVRYWGVGNENWGCGGNFCPESYASEYKRYATYLHDLGQSPLFLIACGPNGDDGNWTRKFMSRMFPRGGPARLHGLAAHYYCGTAGSSRQFTSDQWYELLEKALRIEKLIENQRQIMDEFDPERKVGLVVDEWGTWHPPESPDSRLLWQQNTLRDALAAALTLDAFNRHCDKVVMANIAQMVNVLQSMVLTEGPRMVKTPTFHVFEMYREHQGSQSVRMIVEMPEIAFACGTERRRLPGLTGSASVRNGMLTFSVVNPHAVLPAEMTLAFRGGRGKNPMMRVLTHDDLAAHNTFDDPLNLQPQTRSIDLDAANHCTFPPASVSVIRVELGG